MKPIDYRCFIAIDWSGAKPPNVKGISVALCLKGDEAPDLIPPPNGKSWSRFDAFEFLKDRAEKENCIIGIDCAFSLPFERSGKYFKDDSPHVFDLWALIDQICEEQENGSTLKSHDFYAACFWRADLYAQDFWETGKRPADFKGSEPHRETELITREQGVGAPESPYKLIGAKQVGKGGMAGMRMMHCLKEEINDKIGFWPFEELGSKTSMMMEIYPRLFIKQAGFGNLKLRTMQDLNKALVGLGSKEIDGSFHNLTDHDTDALISAAGLRNVYQREKQLFTRENLSKRAKSYEGWIIGVEPNL